MYRLRQDACFTPIHHSAINIQLNSDEMRWIRITAHTHTHHTQILAYPIHTHTHTHIIFFIKVIYYSIKRSIAYIRCFSLHAHNHDNGQSVALVSFLHMRQVVLYLWYIQCWHNNGKNGWCSMVKRAKLGKLLELAGSNSTKQIFPHNTRHAQSMTLSSLLFIQIV